MRKHSLVARAAGVAAVAGMLVMAGVAYAGSLTFSANNISFSTGVSQSVTITGGSGSYTMSSNSNVGVATAALSGGTITVTGVAAGTATITVCDASAATTCGALTVTITAATSSASGLTFSQNNISLAVGGSQTVTISGGDGTYQISGISSPGVVSAGMAGTGIIVDVTGAGTATITVCDTSVTNVCGGLTVIGTASTAGPAVAFSTSSPTLAVGQSLNVAVTGAASSYFISVNTSANVAQASMTNGGTLALSGVTPGTDSITVCAAGGAGCAPLSVTVTGTTSAPSVAVATPVATPVVTPTVTPVVPVVGTVVANTALLAEIQTLQNAMTQILAQIQSVQTQLNQLQAQVNAGGGSSAGTTASASVAPSVSPSSFTELLTIGSQDSQVTALQERLTTLGFYNGSITGYYGTLTEQAVIKYQAAHGISATGSVGPSTRASLNAG
jgi:Putative peptidoglycan binding domain